MTHAEALRLVRRPPPGRDAPSALGGWQAAVEHVADCSDCWAMIAEPHDPRKPSLPGETGAMNALFGCTEVQRDLYQLGQLAPERMLVEHPASVRHLTWCHACRDRLADVLVAEDAVRRGEIAAWGTVDEQATWRTTATALEETIHELMGTVVVQVGRGVAAVRAAPDGLQLLPALAPATRGTEQTATGRGHRIAVPLDDAGWVAMVTFDAQGHDRVRLGVTLSRPAAAPMSIELFAERDGELELLGGHGVSAEGTAAFREIPAGAYVLDLRERTVSRRRRLRLRIDDDA